MIDEMKKYFDELHEDKVCTSDGRLHSKDMICNYINTLESLAGMFFTKDEILKQFAKDIRKNKQPIKMVVGDYIKKTLYKCPKCGAYLFEGHDNICFRCNQEIDWSGISGNAKCNTSANGV